MKVVAFNGSPRGAEGNTAILIRAVFEPLEAAGIETEIVQVGGRSIRGCMACYQCLERKDGQCVVKGDIVNECYAKMVAADAIILGSPTYFADVSTEMKALIDRCGFVNRANGQPLRRKLGAAVVAVRRGGEIHAFDTMNHFFLIAQMLVIGSSYWNMGFGLDKGSVSQDEEGMKTMRILGENLAWALQKLHA
ncbi:MAG: 2-amino-4-deoxychorismate dehydrogenase [Planctomycetes bacterium ADurb.Bin126]|nr:MAG: 2-amino-4-deoxychorismate dehydrogenase [Planctomycetes bacterium ADurb.Bin126]HOD81130.1 flavodoxin family protein [Phycisphaerae bacterium]HQL72653.1 flavodoxin family protein [Phycisphaerae bacterium]